MFDYLIVGTGYAGAVSARMLADQGKKILMIEKRPHIAGNMYDEYDEQGILVHRYGPHISVMNTDRVYQFLSRFTQWNAYHHRVNAEIDGVEVPLPINFTSIDYLFPVEKALAIKKTLTEQYGEGANVPILEMKKNSDPMVREFAEFVFEKVFVHYTMKMWDLTPEQIDPSVTARIPVRLSYDNRHFLHKYQVMPKHGFTKLFENMLDHPNIEVRLNTLASSVLKIDEQAGTVEFEGKPFEGKVIYTGALDELFQWDMGVLPFRSLEFEFGSVNKDYIQEPTVLNWPDDRPATRRTEMKRLSGQKKEGVTSTIVEYPGAYVKDAEKFGEPMYPINEPECMAMYEKYKARLNNLPQIIPVGRLADYRYYNMEAVIERTMNLIESMNA